MSMPQVTVAEDGEGRGRTEDSSEEEQISYSTQLGLSLRSCGYTQETSPSPSGLLSLPWEMVARIASHLPAQCVINVLPRVCKALSPVSKDTSAWQLRAQRLTGSHSSFPVGQREHFDWPTACLEMEQLIECWVSQKERAEPKQGVEQEQEIQEQEELDRADRERGTVNGAAHEEVAQREPDAVAEGIRYEDAEPHVRQRIEGEKEDNVIIREEERDNGAVEHNHGQHQRPDNSRVDEGTNHQQALEHFALPSGHIADVNAVLLLGGEGSVCVSGSRDRNVNVWDIRRGLRGTLLSTLGARGASTTTHRGWVWCLAASGDLLASGSFDSTIKLWDLQAGGAERGTIKSRAAVLCLSCQQHMLFAGSHDQKVSIYDTRATEPLVKSFRLHGDAVLCLASDEQYILSGSKDNTVAVFDHRAGKLLKKVKLKSYLLSMAYSGREVWAGDNQGLVHTFSMNEGSLKNIAQFNVGHTSLVTGIHYSPGTLYTCSTDRTIKVHLPCAPPKTLCTIKQRAGVNGLSVEAGVLAVASGDMNIEVWRSTQ